MSCLTDVGKKTEKQVIVQMKKSPLSSLFLALILLTAIFRAAAAVPSAPPPLTPADKATTLAPLTLSWLAGSEPAGTVACTLQVACSVECGPGLLSSTPPRAP